MLAAALLALTMMPVAMTGCGGPQCGANTTENGDGECVPDFDAVSCADGTILAEGQCVLDTTGCGANTTLEDGVCVPAESLCGEKTTFNTATGACEAAEECGAGTSANADGECVPAAGACAAGTTLNAEGTCEVASAACGDGTTLDAATGTCALGDTVCGDNTVLANGACTIIADACETGTTFNEGTGTCLPEAVCKPGDAISGGLCVTPAEKLFADATVEVPAGKTDPSDGGTPVELTLPAPGASVIAKGTIEAPYDDDTDPETPDIQDIDYLSFTGTRGQLVRLTLAPTPDSIPLRATVTLDSEDVDWERSTSTIGFGSARYMVLPEDGTYIIEVAPNLGGGFDPVGSDDYDYAIELEAIALGAPAAASAGITGDFTDYTDNFFVLDQTNAGDLVGLNFDALGNGVDGAIVYIFTGDGAGNYTYNSTLSVTGEPASAVFPAFGDDIAVLFGYEAITGSQIGYEVTLGAPTNLEDLGAIAVDTSVDATEVTLDDSSQFFTFSVQAGQVVEIRQDSTLSATLDLFGPGGAVFTGKDIDGFGGTVKADPYAAYFYSPNGGSYTLSASDESSSLTGVVFSIASATPGASTTLAVGESDSKTSATALEQFRREYFTYELTANSLLTIDAVNAGDGLTDLFIFDATTGEEIYAGDEFFDSAFGGEAPAEVPLMAGTYLVGVGAEDGQGLDSGYTLDVSALSPPDFEVEPNETTADASTLSIETSYGLGSVGTGDVDVFTFQLTNAVPAGSFARISVRPDAPVDANTTYTCRLLDSDGTTVLAENSNVSTDCSLAVGTLAATTSYFIEISSNAAAPVDYRVEGTIVEGLLEVEPNNDLMTNATNLGTFTPGTPLVAYGELTTDGTTSDVDAHQITLGAALANETLTVSIDDVWNNGSSATVDVAVFASADLTTPVATSSGLGGTLSFPNLAADTYTLVFTRTDTDVVTSARYRVTVDTVPGVVLSSSPGAPILDNTIPGTSDVITMPSACIITSIEVDVDISHNWRGDMLVTLSSPTGTTVTLHDGTGGSADDIIGTYGGAGTLTSEESLDAFLTEDAAGDWTFYVEDNAGGIAGTLNSWGLRLGCQ